MLVAKWSDEIGGFEADDASDRIFRDALSRFTTGVTIITTDSTNGPIGMTANSFTSVSLDPPLVMWSAAKASRRYSAFEASENIAVHILSQDQSDLCWAFSKSGDAFAQTDWQISDAGTPEIKGSLARFECTKYATYDGGDHAIVVLKVSDLSFRDGEPLVFFSGGTGQFERAG